MKILYSYYTKVAIPGTSPISIYIDGLVQERRYSIGNPLE